MIKKVWLNQQKQGLISVALSYFQSIGRFESQVLCVLLSDLKNSDSDIVMGCFHWINCRSRYRAGLPMRGMVIPGI